MAGCCGAKLRGSDPPRYCTKPPKNGAKRCRLHGADSISGPLHPRWKTGATSKFFKNLPKPLAELASEAYEDPELLSIRDKTALFEARWQMLMRRLESGESGSLILNLNAALGNLQRANEVVRESRAALASGDEDSAERQAAIERLNKAKKDSEDSLQTIFALIRSAGKDESAWQELEDFTFRVTSLQKAEFSRLVTMKQVMTLSEAMEIFHGLLSEIREVVTDPKVRIDLGIRLQRLLNRAAAAAGNLPSPQANEQVIDGSIEGAVEGGV
jgi:exonuclease VII small subunit